MDWVKLWLVAVLQNHLKLKTSFSTERKVFCPSSVPGHSSGCPSFSKLICLLISTVSLCTPGYPRDPPASASPLNSVTLHHVSLLSLAISALRLHFFLLKIFLDRIVWKVPLASFVPFLVDHGMLWWLVGRIYQAQMCSVSLFFLCISASGSCFVTTTKDYTSDPSVNN